LRRNWRAGDAEKRKPCCVLVAFDGVLVRFDVVDETYWLIADDRWDMSSP
jgi:hypothetical protein